MHRRKFLRMQRGMHNFDKSTLSLSGMPLLNQNVLRCQRVDMWWRALHSLAHLRSEHFFTFQQQLHVLVLLIFTSTSTVTSVYFVIVFSPIFCFMKILVASRQGHNFEFSTSKPQAAPSFRRPDSADGPSEAWIAVGLSCVCLEMLKFCIQVTTFV